MEVIVILLILGAVGYFLVRRRNKADNDNGGSDPGTPGPGPTGPQPPEQPK